jgi:uncharacterized protein
MVIRYTMTCKENYFTGGVYMEQLDFDEKLKEKVELSILFDFYGELLKNHNKHIFEDYILNDLSLSEIAEEQGISRQGVYDIVKRCTKQLKECEEKLSLIKKFDKTKIMVNRIKELSVDMRYTQELNKIDEILELTENILRDL